MSSNPDVPPFTGYVETTVNALRLIHAARQGVIPRITRRLNDSERRSMIKSGAVFVFSVEESGIKRWTDGLLWSPSRIVGNFLVYREINERTSSRGGHKKPYPGEDSPTRALTRKCSPDQLSLGYKSHGGGDQGTFKVGGLIKKTITVTIEGSDLHLISYYTSEDIRSGRLKRPSTRSDIMSLYMPPHIFRLANFRVPPKMETGPDGKPRLVSETEDSETVDCKVEDQGYNIPASPTWSSQAGSPTSPIDSSFNNSSIYSLSSGQGHGNGYSRQSTQDRWSSQAAGESLLNSVHRQDMSWSPSTNALSSAHALSRRRDGSGVLHSSDGWSGVGNQHSGARWLAGQDHSSSSPSSLYQDRPRIRSIAHPYDDAQLNHRRDSDSGIQSNYISRYPAPPGTREGALQRLHWHTRDTPDVNVRDIQRRNTTQSTGSFTPSPPMTYTSQGYHAPTYTSSWTASDSLLTTPTLHPISQSTMSYDANYTTTGTNALSSTEEYSSVEEYQDS
ncbi:hypothetical protein D9613_008055 [Agrocybe pediades]|uniref:Gti1/Pac2 family-domain-containing protein n=1 Tax=Agrocybe pediades TaxID=84607 RepID=A0A8H4QMQ8_9AGAR|nr:hypothetical protein D9613_008055 [Agrocybe pediades]